MHSSMLFAFAVLLISGARGDKQPERPSAATCAAQTSATDETIFLQASRVLKVGSNISDHGLAGNSEKATGDASANEGDFPNGIIPVEAEKSKAILISIVLCHDHPGVASAIAQACSLANVELWVLTNEPEDCQFGEWHIAPTYIKSEGADKHVYVRDFLPTLTLSAETGKAHTALTFPYRKPVQNLEAAVLAQLRSSYNEQLPHRSGTGFDSEWGAFLPDSEGFCTVGRLGGADKMAEWLEGLGVCQSVAQLAPIDEATGHADIAMAVAGPHSYLVSFDPNRNDPESGHGNPQRVLDMLQPRGVEAAWGGLPFSEVTAGGHTKPSSYANALVVHGAGGIYLVFPTYESIYAEWQTQESHNEAKTTSMEAWLQALRIDEQNVIEVDVGKLYGGGGAIHCATKNYPVSKD